MDYDYRNLRVDRGDGGIFTVRVDRPEVLNALDDATFGELDHCAGQLVEDADCRAVIITGSGEKAFVAGADIGELVDQDPLEAQRRSRTGQRIFSRLERLGKPVVAAVNGFALGGGCELALACHLRYAAEGARFGLPEVSLGIIPGYGGTQRLGRLVGMGRAFEWVLTGDMIDAAEAYRIGLVNGVFPAGELIPKVEELVARILSRGPLAVRFAMEAVLRGADATLAEGLSIESDLFGVISASRDMKEGMRAFLDKRQPDFQGS